MPSRSPFPGMDPWLEAHWGDVHHSLVQYYRDQLAEALPSGLFARVEETVTIVDRWSTELGIRRPDVAAFESRNSTPERPEKGARANVVVAEPLRIRMRSEPIVEGHIEIRRIEGGEPLVTAIEVLSTTNKLDPRGRRDYKRKRKEYYRARVNVVEIDLLRSGRSLLDVSTSDVPAELATPYSACVRRAPTEGARWEAEYYALPLRQSLPAIRIPLRPDDPDVVLDLQAPLDRAYRLGRYADQIDYHKPPRPPLSSEDAAWAAELVKKAGPQG